MSQLSLLRAHARAAATMDDSGRWITTENGNHVHLDKSGKPDKGNPHVINAMKGGKSKEGKKSDKPKKDADKPKKSGAKASGGKEKGWENLSPDDYYDKFKKPKPYGVYGNKVHFADGNYTFRGREVELPKKGVTFSNASEEQKSDMRAILKGLAKFADKPSWKEVAEKFLPAAESFYKGTDFTFIREDLDFCKKRLEKLRG